jgi:hypothetical protein
LTQTGKSSAGQRFKLKTGLLGGRQVDDEQNKQSSMLCFMYLRATTVGLENTASVCRFNLEISVDWDMSLSRFYRLPQLHPRRPDAFARVCCSADAMATLRCIVSPLAVVAARAGTRAARTAAIVGVR